ncbi:phosphatidylglycerol lysyltransferase domain-containing protein [Streptomyces sp. RB6PN25]|uniref:Phosphatidylglycerol lysyltransferase domain-containing protein n=1 Tax=Streptomyces humicola TaxID=2953240 RepID=A0ABT1PVE3_9ACTN|nr:phosphatidylglycerol lysyltransferase domain-containing protein [Streptomyces humicola]MCQ4081609.1 phosphatidylglycerol lysyltransferase domain-containing protein [Streptomyces humicola]
MGLLPTKRDELHQSPQGGRPGRWQRYGAGYAVWYLRAVAVINLLGAVWASFGQSVRRHNVNELYTPYLLTAGFTSTLFAIFLAVTMRRGKRAAWILNLLLNGLFVVALALAMTFPEIREHRQNWVSLVLSAAFLLALLAGRKAFRAKGGRSNPVLALGVAVCGTAVCVLIGTFLVSVTNTGYGSTLGDRVAYTGLRVVTLASGDTSSAAITTPDWVNVVINVMSAFLFLLVLYAAFRAPGGRELLGPQDESRLRELLAQHGGRDSLGYFALRRDKSVIWSPTGKAAIAYRVVGGVTLASGDPIGDPEAWPGAIEPWLAEARMHGWTPAVMGASEEGGTIYARHGLDALEIGDEAIVETAEFTLEGRAMRTVRQAYNRVRRAGYTVRIRRHEDIPEQEMAELLERADRWRGCETERGFSMALGRLGDAADGRCVMVECHDADGDAADGAPRALLSFVPWGETGLSLDLMRRDRDSDNGLIEFMVIELLQRAGEIGVEQISLNFAMFRSVFERGSRLGAGPVLRLWRSLLTFFSRWWQIESLYRANAKYRPIWEPRYVLFRTSSELPRIGLAAARAEGFLEAPSLPALLRRRHRSPAPVAAPAGSR